MSELVPDPDAAFAPFAETLVRPIPRRSLNDAEEEIAALKALLCEALLSRCPR